MFFDEINLELEGGHGGNGMVSFHREKFVAFGPPDGGDGGLGGSVILIADSNHNTFRHFSGKKHFKGESGKGGHKNNSAGHGGEDLILKVPIGTVIFDAATGDKLVDLKEKGQTYIAAKGGRGGFGNSHFSSSTRQAPKFAELGDVGQHKKVRLELQLVADVGLVGFPSAGKSTLISHLSAAKPKIGDYPFTTLIPNLGVVNLGEFGGSSEQTFVIADMPGLIEGASEGKGLGDRFLKHVSRTALIVYLLDPFSYDGKTMSDQYRILKKEIGTYKESLLKKGYYIVMNKIDAIPDEDRKELTDAFLKDFPKEKKHFSMASGVSGEALDKLVFALWNSVQEQKEEIPEQEEAKDEEPVYAPVAFVDDQSFKVVFVRELKVEDLGEPVTGQLISDKAKPERQIFHVTGERIEQISRMTNTAQPDGVQRVYDVLNKMGIHDELRRTGAVSGDYIKIGPHVFEYHDLRKE